MYVRLGTKKIGVGYRKGKIGHIFVHENMKKLKWKMKVEILTVQH